MVSNSLIKILKFGGHISQKDPWSVHTYQNNANYVSRLGQDLVKLLAPQAKETILDLGAGEGSLALDIKGKGAHVLCVDQSPSMVATCRKKGLEVETYSAEKLPYKNRFDAVFSNAMLHWVKDHPRMMRCVYRALKTGGRFVAEMGGANNVRTITKALEETLKEYGLDYDHYNPWTFPKIDEYRTLLEKTGFIINHIEIFPRPTLLTTDILGWLKTFSFSFLKDIPVQKKTIFLKKVAQKTSPVLHKKNRWYADYVRLRFSVSKK